MKARPKVTTMWLVNVNFTGVSPIRLPNRMKVNSVNTNGMCAVAFGPTFLTTVPATKTYSASTAP